MFFIKDQYTLGYKWGQPTYYGTKHLGQDYLCSTGTKVYAPFNGTVVRTFYGTEGGYTTWFVPDGQNRTFRFLHLSKQIALAGLHVQEGELIALSGNTGTQTTAPHIHFDAFNGLILPSLIYTNFINPATINYVTTPPPPPMNIHRIIVLLSHVTQPQLDALKQAVALVQARVALQGNIRVEVDYYPTDAVFHTITTAGDNGQPLVFADPAEIATVGHQAELALNKQVDSVGLIYDGALVVGTPPTNPVENPIIIEGFNPFSIPTNWFTNPTTGEVFMESCELYFYHEMLHAWYYIINVENPTIGVPDMVHSYVPPTGPGEATLEANLKYFDSLVLQLKPYWASLANSDSITGEPMLTYKFTDNPTEYVLSDDATLIPMTAAGLTKVLAGRPEKLVFLAPSERAKYKVVTAVVN